VSRTSRIGGFGSPEARKSASAIYSRSVERMRAGAVREGSMGRGNERRSGAPTAPGRSYSAPSRGGERRFIGPERSFSAPSRGSEGRSFAPGPSRQFSSGPVTRGEGAIMRSYAGNGWHGRGFENGGTCRGKC
jgi:hypothetical protein